MNAAERRKEALDLLAQLKMERVSFEAHWQELADNLLPRRVKITGQDRNRGDKRNTAIKNETPIFALRTLRAGMMGGLTSPSRQWFNVTTSSPYFKEDMAVKMWLQSVTELLRETFIKSNLYHALPIVYGDMAAFGTAAMGIEETLDGSVAVFTPFQVGSFYIGQTSHGKVNVFIREFDVTVRQLVNDYGRQEDGSIKWGNISDNVKNKWEAGHKESWETILHVITPNEDYNPNSPTSFQYNSVHLEYGAADERILRTAGFHYFPVLSPRWEVAGSDIYGTSCPGMDTLASVKTLHNMENRSMQAVEKMINPPLQGPMSLQAAKVSVIPGDVTYVDERQGMNGLRPIYEVTYDLNAHEAKMAQIGARISKGFFEDLFLMFSDMESRDRVTATEISARREEKLLILGPVLERLNQDLLDPLVETVFYLLLKQGLVPEPPEQLQGYPLKIEYISIMHQAQKSMGLAGIDRLKEHALAVMQLNPSSGDKFNFDQMTDEIASILGVSPNLVLSDEAVMEIRQQRAAEQARLEATQSQMQNTQMLLDAGVTQQ